MKTILRITPPASAHWVGDGFPVKNLLSLNRDALDTSPFLMLDHAGPYSFTPTHTPRGVGAHPHRGFETVTIVYAGEVSHRDSAGNSGTISVGDVQWMTAARGVLHDEFHSKAFAEKGGMMEMAQLWVNLPARFKMSEPRYQGITAGQIPNIALPNGAGTVRVIAGEYEGTQGAAQTYSPLNMWALALHAGHSNRLSVPQGWTCLLVVLHGTVRVNGTVVVAEHIAHLSPTGQYIDLTADDSSQCLLLSGEPLNEPLAHYGPFVMNTQRELHDAFDDFESGAFGKL